MAFKISLIYVQDYEKRIPTHTCQLGPKIRFGNSDFVDLDRLNFCRALFLNLDGYYFCRGIFWALMNSFSSLIYWSNLHDFNTWLEQHVSWSTKHILDLPNYKWSAFCQKISQLNKNNLSIWQSMTKPQQTNES